MYYEFTDHFIVAADQAKTWAFFSDATNLPKITPPALGFNVLTPSPIQMAADTLIDYTIKLAGVRLHWRTRIIDWSPPHQFIDLQIKGPYTLWHHQHTFLPASDGTECRDRVIYKVPGPLIGRAIHALAIRRQLFSIFRFRREILGRELGLVRAIQDVTIRKLS